MTLLLLEPHPTFDSKLWLRSAFQDGIDYIRAAEWLPWVCVLLFLWPVPWAVSRPFLWGGKRTKSLRVGTRFQGHCAQNQNQMLVWARMTVPSWNCWCALSNIHNQKGVAGERQGTFSHLKKWHRISWRWENIQNQVWISSFIATQNSSNFRCELCCLITLFQNIHPGYSLHQQWDEDQICLLPSIIPRGYWGRYLSLFGNESLITCLIINLLSVMSNRN